MTIQYDPQKVTDWLTPLEKVYARQSQQLDRYHAQLRERDRQEEAAIINLPEIASQLASFSKTIGQVMEARKTERKIQYTSDYANIPRSGEDRKLEAAAYRLIKDGILKEDVRFQNVLKDMSPDLREALSNASGAQQVWGAEYNIKEKLKYLGRDQWKSSYLPGKFESEVETKSLQEQNEIFRGWINEEISPFKISKGLRASAIDEQIEKLISTNSTTSKIKQKVRFTGAEQLTFAQGLATDVDAEDYNSIVSRIHHRIQVLAGRDQRYTAKGAGLNYSVELDETEIQKAAVQVFGELNDLAFNQKLTVDQIEKIINLEGVTDHPAGKTLKKVFLNQAGENALVQSARDGANFKLKQIEAKADSDAAILLTQKHGSQADFDRKALPLLNKVSPDMKKKLEKFNQPSQGEDVYNDTIKKYSEIVNGNDPAAALQLKPNIDLEGNDIARTKLLAISTEASQALTAANLPKDWSKYFQTVKVDMIAESGIDKTLDPDATFTENQERVQLFVAKHRLNTLIKTLRIGESVETANGIHQAWLKGHGWGQVNGGGMLSPNSEGVFERFEFVKDAKIQNTTKPSKFQQETWTSRIHNTTNSFKGDIEAALNKAESYIDKEDSLGAFIEKVNEKGEIELFYSPELITKSLALGRQPSYVLKKSIEALIANKEKYGDFVKMFDLENKLKLLDNAPDLKFKEMLEELGNKDLIYSYNYAGGFTPKQSQRIINTIKNEALIASVKENDEKDFYRKQANIKRNNELRTKANQTPLGTQEYFRGTDDRTDEELDEQFNEFNAQPGLF